MRKAIFVGSFVCSTMAAAQTRPLPDTLTGTAKSDYDSAKVLFADGDFAGAELKFQGALNNSHDARLYWNIAACEKSQRHYARAAQFVRQYIDQAQLSAQERSDANAVFEVLVPLTVRLTIAVDQPDAQIRVDDTVVGSSPLDRPIIVDLGAHKVTAHKAGFSDATKDVNLIEHEVKMDLRLTVAPLVTAAPPTPTPTATQQHPVGPPEARAAGEVRFQLQLPASTRPDDRWVLRDKTARELCVLPCEQWLPAGSGSEVARWRNGGYDTRITLPASPPGSTAVVAQPRVQGGWHTLGWAFIVAGAVMTVATLPLLAVHDASTFTIIGAAWGATFWIPGIVLLTLPSNDVAIHTVAARVTPFGISGVF